MVECERGDSAIKGKESAGVSERDVGEWGVRNDYGLSRGGRIGEIKQSCALSEL